MGKNLTNIIIAKADGSRVPIANRRTATDISSAKQKWALNAEDTVSLTVVSPFPQTYGIGDKITVFGRDYKLNRLPKAKKTGMHEFQYDLEFEGIQYDLFRVTYDVTIDTTTNELQDVQGDTLTGDLHRFMTVLIANANRVFPGKWVLGVCPETAGDKTLTFGESDNCLSVLQNLCSESNFNVEFEIEQSNSVYTINLYAKVGQTLPYTFQYGRGRGLYELTRENVSSANIVTRLKVYGSTENITSKYRADRLCLPGKTKGQSYIEKAEMVAKYGVFEGRKNFDDIKPSFTGTVDAVVSGNVLQFIDNDFPFNLNEKEADGVTTKYLINEVAAKIHFNTGNLAGYEFEVHSYDHATHTFTLVKQTDDRGNVFPSETSLAYQIGVGNEYKILDIAYPSSIEQAAEEELEETGNKYYDQNCQPKVQYGLNVTKAWLQNLVGSDETVTNVFQPGDYLHIVDNDIDVDKSVRIQSLERNILDPYEYNLTISDTVKTSVTNRVISDLIDIDKVITINNLKDPARARANWRTSRELLNMVFDPDGDYYSDKIKPLSIDTLALSVGAKSMQFGLTNTVFQPNYGGNANVVKWQGGVLTHYTINEETAVSWVMADGTVTLSNNQAYFLYAKCAKNGNAGTFIFSTSQIKVEQDASYYHFLIGTISSIDPELKVRSLSLTYGFSMINGRFIKTGRVESSDGKTYFDLDNNEIGGNIKFRSTGSEELVGIEQGIANAVDGVQVGIRNLIAKQYLLDWNETDSRITTQGSDEDGEYLEIDQQWLFESVADGASGIGKNDIFQGKIKYKENTQYAFKVRWKLGGVMDYSGLIFQFWYTDGTKDDVVLGRNEATLIEKKLITKAGKTLQKISSSYGTNTYKTLIYDIQLTEGNKQPEGYATAPEDLQAGIDGVQEQLDGLEVGGENLITETETDSIYLQNMMIPSTLSATLAQGLPAGQYVFSYEAYRGMAFGTSIGGVVVIPPTTSLVLNGTTIAMLNSDTKRYTFTATDNSTVMVRIPTRPSGSVTITRAMLQRGNKPTAYQRAMQYLTDAFTKGSTDINGGVLATNLLQLKGLNNGVTSGMSGLEDNILLWGGGSYAQALAETVKTLLRKDGSGYFAGKKFSWDNQGGMNVGIFSVKEDSIEVVGNNSKVVITSRNTDNISEFDNSEQTSINSTTRLKTINSGSGTFSISQVIGRKTFNFSKKSPYHVSANLQICIYGACYVNDAQTKPQNTTISLHYIRIIAKSANGNVYRNTGQITVEQSKIIRANEREVGTGNATIYTPGYDNIKYQIPISLDTENNITYEIYIGLDYSISQDGGGYVWINFDISNSDVYTTSKSVILASNGMLLRSSGKSYMKIENTNDELNFELNGLPQSATTTGALYKDSDGFIKVS